MSRAFRGSRGQAGVLVLRLPHGWQVLSVAALLFFELVAKNW
jgi:hypothetical protein